jgi:hypothetical protein
MWSRLWPLIVTFLLGGLLAVFCVGGLPLAGGFGDRLYVWLVVLSGPGFATASGSLAYNPALGVGWLGVPLLVARLARPSGAAAWIGAVGVAVWLLSGLLTVAVYS